MQSMNIFNNLRQTHSEGSTYPNKRFIGTNSYLYYLIFDKNQDGKINGFIDAY